MLVQDLLVLLFAPFAFVPEFIHFCCCFACEVIGDYLAQFMNFFWSFHCAQQTKDSELCLV